MDLKPGKIKMIKKKNISEKEIHKIIHNIINQINQNLDVKITDIVAIAKGGLIPARYIAKYLEIDKIYSIGIKYYTDIQKTMKVPHIYQHLTNKFHQSDVILIVDDVVDSGESISVAMTEVVKCGAKKIATASLHYKNKSKYIPDFYGEECPNELWLTYNWE